MRNLEHTFLKVPCPGAVFSHCIWKQAQQLVSTSGDLQLLKTDNSKHDISQQIMQSICTALRLAGNRPTSATAIWRNLTGKKQNLEQKCTV